MRRRFILVIQEAVSSGVEEGGRYTPLDKNVEEDEERDTFDDEMGKWRPDDVAPKDETPEKGKTSCLKVPPWCDFHLRREPIFFCRCFDLNELKNTAIDALPGLLTFAG